MRIVGVHNDPARLGHCVVEAEIDGLRLFATHFDSHAEDLRVREAEYVNSIADLATPCIVAGDLNALSRRDPYPSDLAELVRRANVDKYGHPPRFDTIDALERAGWIDARPEGGWITARRDRGGVRIDYRTDYVFFSPPMAQRFIASRVVPGNGASDHDAILAEFREPATS
jgi:exodeoxyribonuclease-3